MKNPIAHPAFPALVVIIDHVLKALRDKRPRSTMEIVTAFKPEIREQIKELLLYLGDSRRPDRELDLGRDDRTEAMMGEEERELMPSEVQDGRRVYYCTVQRRAK